MDQVERRSRVEDGKGRLTEPAFPFHNQISTFGQLG